MKIVHPIKDIEKIEEIKFILREQNLRNLLLFVMGINTALRISDLLSLTVGDVRDEQGQTRAFVSVRETKTDKLKEIPLNESIQDILQEYLRSCMDDSQYLFTSNKGGAISRVQAYRILNGAGLKAGIECVGTHTLRKTFGYHAYRQTENLGLVQQLLNHGKSCETLRYIGIDQDDLNAAYLSLNL